MTTLASVWTFDCCVWCHISCMWLFIHVSVRINFFFCMSWSNDQSTYKLPEHFWNVIIILFLFWSLLFYCAEFSGAIVICVWNEMKCCENTMLLLFFHCFFCPEKPFGKCFYCSLSLHTFHSLITLDIFYCSLSRTLWHLRSSLLLCT